MKLASIDIGSNAVRLLLTQVLYNHQPFFSKDALIRIPIRLGEDAFIDGSISDEKREKLVTTMIGFKYLIEAYKPLDIKACATAAMREASNGSEIVNDIKEKAGIDVEIITGCKEAEIICGSHMEKKFFSPDTTYLFIDVGGGSTEMTLFSDNKPVISESFNIGAVRIIKKRVNDSHWDMMKAWIKEHVKPHGKVLEAIGSGGNINKLYKFSGKKEQTFLTYKKIKKIHTYLNSFTCEERIRVLNLHMDRADVIIPAVGIFLKIMKWAKVSTIHVPQIGLADGLIRGLYESHNTRQLF